MAYNHLHLLRELDRMLADEPSISLAEIVRQTGVGRHTLANLVRLHRGLSFRGYRERKLIAEACRLLDQAGVSVKEVAITLGYEHPRDFSRFFRRATGKSPQAYRERANVGEKLSKEGI